jgi:DUF1365 family protein
MSSSSSALAAGLEAAEAADPAPRVEGIFFSPVNFFFSSAEKDLMWLYHLRAWGVADVGGFENAS